MSEHSPANLGICCVYFYGDDGDWLLPLQLNFIAETLPQYTYTIYAAANRLKPDLLKVLAGTPHVKIIDLPHCDERANSEHAFYLDKLLQFAYADGCSHLIALDSDSFPVVKDWPNLLLERMQNRLRFAAVLRTENGDTSLPHPCAYFMTRDFYSDHQPSLFATQIVTQTENYREFITSTRQRTDTGIGYGYALWSSREEWLKLRRSNRHDFHFLMAGIYGEIFFHLGSSSRRPGFHMDYQTRLSLKLAGLLHKLPFLWRLSEIITERYLARNQQTYQQITSRLKSDPHQFIEELRRSSP